MSQPLTAGSAGHPTLARDLAEALIELSIVLNKFSIYPSSHPSLEPAAGGLLMRFEQLLTERSALSVGVARQQLVIEGVATDPKNPVLKDLAGRLNRRQLGAIAFMPGLEAGELFDFLTVVASEPDHAASPVSVAHDPRTSGWSHVRLYPPMYDRLELVEEDGHEATGEDAATRGQRTRAAQLWVGLARAALAIGDLPGPAASTVDTAEPPLHDATDDVPTDPAAVARAIDEHPRGAAYDQVIVGYMLQIADELRSAGGQEALQLKKRMSRLVSTLDSKTLKGLLEMGGNGLQRRTFVMSAAHGMSIDAVVDLVRAASEAEEQTISHSLLRMLQKLARHADASGGKRRAIAEQSVRDQVGELLQGWSLKDPNPEAYGKALEAMARSDSLGEGSGPAQTAEPRRLVAMALEVDSLGDPIERAVAELVQPDHLRWLVDTLNGAEPSAAQAEVWRLVATPDALAEALRGEPVDSVVVDALLAQLGERAGDVLLDALSDVAEASTRRLVLDRLTQLGPVAADSAIERLQDPRWYVQRNMLKLLGDLEQPVVGFRPVHLLEHDDARVRREALRVLLRDTEARGPTIVRALADPDDRMVRTALTSALQDCPDGAVTAVVSLAKDGRSQDHRVLAIRVLGASAVPQGLDVLLGLTEPRQGLFRLKPPAKTLEYLAALAALSRFAADPRARDILQHAAESGDPKVVRAARGASPH